MLNIIMSVILTFSVALLQLSHPMAIAMVLIFQTFMSIILMGALSISYWFSYVTFLIFIGGVLILFMYMTSISSNELFNFSSWMMTFLIFLFMLFFNLLYLNPKVLTFTASFSYDKYLMSQFNFLGKEMFLMKIFNYPSTLMTIFLVMYMFFALIVISKIINISQGPLRQQN